MIHFGLERGVFWQSKSHSGQKFNSVIPNCSYFDKKNCSPAHAVKVTKPKADEALLGNVQAALLIQVGVLGINLVPETSKYDYSSNSDLFYFNIILS